MRCESKTGMLGGHGNGVTLTKQVNADSAGHLK